MRTVVATSAWQRTGHGLRVACAGGGSCTVSVLSPHVVRVALLREAGPIERRSWMVPAPGAADVPWEGRDRRDLAPWPETRPEIVEHDGTLRLATGAMEVTLRLGAPLALRWSLPDGRVFAADRPSAPCMLGRDAALHAMARHPEDRYYGLGDKTGPLDLHGRRLRTAMRDALGYDARTGDPLYRHWPFLIVRDGATGLSYGTLYDNAAEAAFDLGAEHDNYHGLYRSWSASGDLDYVLMLGPSLAEVTPRFLDLTGRNALPPRWSLGYGQTAMGIADRDDAADEMARFVDRCAEAAIPVSSFHFGSGYTSIGPRRYVFHWNRQKFPDPEATVRRFHDAGMRVVANLKPCLLDDHPRYAEAAAAGAFVTDGAGAPLLSQFWDGEGAHLDFTAADGIAFWREGLRRAVLDVGIDCGWNDNNEYPLPDEDATVAGFGEPASLAATRPVQALLMTRTTRDVQRETRPQERVYTVSRAGMPGIQRYAQAWSGDNTTGWHALRWNLRTGLQMSLSGMHNTGHDVGGFAGPLPGPELLARWVECGVLHPRFVMNSWKPGGEYSRPWMHPEVLAPIRDAIRLRYRLIPYLWSLLHQSAAANAPVLRPTFLDFEDDARCFADCDEAMLGPFLLAAPVLEPGLRARRLYLPRGPECWFDLFGAERLAAGAEAVVAAPLGRPPLLARAGTILPLAEDGPSLHDDASRRLLLLPGPGAGESAFTLVEDDGLSADGPSTRVALRLSWTERAVRLRAEATGDYALPWPTLGVSLPPGERRPLAVEAPGLPPVTRLAYRV